MGRVRSGFLDRPSRQDSAHHGTSLIRAVKENSDYERQEKCYHHYRCEDPRIVLGIGDGEDHGSQRRQEINEKNGASAPVTFAWHLSFMQNTAKKNLAPPGREFILMTTSA